MQHLNRISISHDKIDKKILISVVGRFHAFDLARVLYKQNILYKILTTYPHFLIAKFGIPKTHSSSEFLFEVLKRVCTHLKFINLKKINRFIDNMHDLNCTRYIDKCNIFIGWSGLSYKSMIKAKKLGIITILERGSAHTAFLHNLLDEEYKHLKLDYSFNTKEVEKDILEYNEADYISIPSTFVLNSFLKKGFPRNKFLVNPYGVNTEEFPIVNNRTEKFKIIFVGRASILKGFHYLLEALHRLNNPKIELIHVGHFYDEMIHFRQKFYNANVRYEGPKPQNKLYKYYGEAYAFVFPSLQEGLALVQLQAMSCGLPLICTFNSGGEDLITEGIEGFVLKIRDVNALCEKILFFKENTDKALIMGQKAREKVLNNFTWEHYGERYKKNLDNLKQFKDHDSLNQKQ